MKTQTVNPESVERKWWILDAKDMVLGRLASTAAHLLLGKHKASYSPLHDHGDHVIIVNADQAKLTGKKQETKRYFSHSQKPGGWRNLRGRGRASRRFHGSRHQGNASEKSPRPRHRVQAPHLPGRSASACGAEARDLGPQGRISKPGGDHRYARAIPGNRSEKDRRRARHPAPRQRPAHHQQAPFQGLFRQ